MESTARNSHVVYQQGTALFRPTHNHVCSDGADTGQHVFQITGNGNFFYRMLDFAIFDPEPGRSARVISCNRIDPMAEQFGYKQPLAHLFYHVRKLQSSGSIKNQIVIAARVASAGKPELSAGITSEKIALHHPAIDHLAIPCRDPLVVESSTRQTFFQMWQFADLNVRRKYLPANAIQQE